MSRSCRCRVEHSESEDLPSSRESKSAGDKDVKDAEMEMERRRVGSQGGLCPVRMCVRCVSMTRLFKDVLRVCLVLAVGVESPND